MHAGGGLLGGCAKLRGEIDRRAAARLAVVEGTGGDGNVEHFFEAEGLGAELDFVPLAGFGFAAFVLYGEGWGFAGFGEFDNVGDAGKAKAEAANGEGADDAGAMFGFVGAMVGFVVEDFAFGGEAIFGPGLFNVDEAPLPLAEGEVLEGGERQQVGG